MTLFLYESADRDYRACSPNLNASTWPYHDLSRIHGAAGKPNMTLDLLLHQVRTYMSLFVWTIPSDNDPDFPYGVVYGSI